MHALSADTLDDCFTHDRDRLTHEAAVRLITCDTRPIVAATTCPLDAAVGRTVALAVAAERAVPGHDNAAVDGYAIRHRDLDPKGQSSFTLVDRIAAGDAGARALGPGETARIFTGAPVPDGADTVVMQENATPLAHGRVSLPHGIARGANLRRAGEDIKSGDVIVRPGDRLRAQDVAALASLGLGEIAVFAPLSVGVLSSGNEVRRPGDALGPSGVYDANSHLLRALLAALPVEAIDLGIVADDRRIVETRLAEAAARCDLVITSGGASRGEEDHLVRALAEAGGLHLWQIAVKPGRPLGLGLFNGTRVLMLPGNPVAVMVCYLLYALPLITLLGGGIYRDPRRYRLPAGFQIRSRKTDRREFLRGRIVDQAGDMTVVKYPRDGSGLISSLRAADGLIEITESVARVDRGDPVAFIPFSEFGLHAG
jgi:molybdopterin molybdotransferase